MTSASRVIARGYEALADGERIRVVSEDASAMAAARRPAAAHEPLHRLPHEENDHGTRRTAQRHEAYHKGGETITPLDDVSLDVEEGEFVSLMGASGTGKSTLLNLIASIDRPDSGTITVDGTDITKLSRTQLANWRAANIGYIFQTHNLIPVLTAYENVELPLLLLPMSRAERQKRVGDRAGRRST